jgi:glycosyltransferase involved in cell wall biosynthesis
LPDAAIIVPAYNAAATLGDAVGSGLAQLGRSAEVIVVDDGSTDETREVARRLARDPRVRVIEQANSGPSTARNAGVAATDAEFVAFLDSDDLLAPQYLTSMLDALDSSAGAAFAFTDAWVVDEHAGRVMVKSAMEAFTPPALPADPLDLLRLLVVENFVYTAVTARREVLVSAGGFNENLRRSEDYELWMRLLSRGHPAICVPGRLAVHRLRPGSLADDEAHMLESMQDVWGIVLADFPVDDQIKRIARTRIEWADDQRALARPRTLAERIRAGRLRLRNGLRARLLRAPTWRNDMPAELDWLREVVLAREP